MPSEATKQTFTFASIAFAGMFFLIPLPVLIFEGCVPLARFYLLATVCTAVAATEGTGGPVGAITALLLAHAVVYTAVVIAAALLARRLLRGLPHRAAIALLVGAIAAGVIVASIGEPYVTPFGPHPRSNLIGVLS